MAIERLPFGPAPGPAESVCSARRRRSGARGTPARQRRVRERRRWAGGSHRRSRGPEVPRRDGCPPSAPLEPESAPRVRRRSTDLRRTHTATRRRPRSRDPPPPPLFEPIPSCTLRCPRRGRSGDGWPSCLSPAHSAITNSSPRRIFRRQHDSPDGLHLERFFSSERETDPARDGSLSERDPFHEQVDPLRHQRRHACSELVMRRVRPVTEPPASCQKIGPPKARAVRNGLTTPASVQPTTPPRRRSSAT